ncbi:hypothetical protein ACFX19_045972 [Malus domestica]
MRKLLEFDFSTAIDGAVKDEAAKIKVVEVEVSDERTVKCKSGCCPLTICCLFDLQAFDLLNYVAFSHWRAYPNGCQGFSLPSRIIEQLVYPLALESN